MNSLDKNYQELLFELIEKGIKKNDRTGTGTRSLFGRQIRHKMSEGFPLLTTKKMYWKGIVTELLWFLRGDTNINYLVDNDCHIWDGDAYKYYTTCTPTPLDAPARLSKEEFINRIKTDDDFAYRYGNLGPIYGKQWRRVMVPYNMMVIDQISNLLNDLKTDPNSRRLMVNAWNVAELDSMVLPPCHYGFQCYVRDGKYLSLMWSQRSVDTFLGLPFNIASYGLLLTILAKEVNMVPDQLIGNLGDTHLYLNHIEQAKEQITREPFELPTLNQFPIYEGSRPSIESYVVSDFTLKDYKSHESIKAPLSN